MPMLWSTAHTVVCGSCSMNSIMPLYLIVSTDALPPPFVTEPQPPYEYQQSHKCESCGSITVIVAPLLVTNFGGSPPLFFLPMEGVSQKENQQGLEYLLEHLRGFMGDAWRMEYLSDLQVIDRRDLPTLWRSLALRLARRGG
jgi:hypothetical protein